MSTRVPSPSESRARRWLRVLRPMMWWLALVLAMFAWRKHQEWSFRTRLVFSVALEGKPAFYEASSTLDRLPIMSSSQVSLGWHTFTVVHPKGDPFTTNLFIWYGERDLGQIQLKRSRDTLAVTAVPPADRLEIRGPEYAVTLTNSSGQTASVPTDNYTVRAYYPHSEQTETALVSAGATASVRITQQLGTLQMICNQQESSYELSLSGTQRKLTGKFPDSIAALPAGTHQLIARHGLDTRELRVTVKAGATNQVAVEFNYGSAVLESEPPGAGVVMEGGNELGVTPLRLPGLRPGVFHFTLQKEGYEPVTSSLVITANETNQFRTNLVNTRYPAAMRDGRKSFAAGDYQRAGIAAAEALQAVPDSEEARKLQTEATVQLHLQNAKALSGRNDYEAALKELNYALVFQPDNADARKLTAEYQKGQQGLKQRAVELAAENQRQLAAQTAELKRKQEAALVELERQRLAALAEKEKERQFERPKVVFDEWMKRIANSELFTTQEMRFDGKVADFESRLLMQFTNGSPAFNLIKLEYPETNVFQMTAKQSMGAGGFRLCNLLAGEVGGGEFWVIFEVFEYAYPESFSLRALIGEADTSKMVPIHRSRLDASKAALLSRRVEGIKLVNARIDTAVRSLPPQTKETPAK